MTWYNYLLLLLRYIYIYIHIIVTYILTLSLLTAYDWLSARETSKDGFHRLPAGHACSGKAKSQKTNVSVGLTCQCGRLFRGRNCNNSTHSLAGKRRVKRETDSPARDWNGRHSLEGSVVVDASPSILTPDQVLETLINVIRARATSKSRLT